MVSRILTNKVKAMSLTQSESISLRCGERVANNACCADWDGVGETDYLRKSLEDVIREDLEEMQIAEPESYSGSSSDSDSDESDSDSDNEVASKKDEATETKEGEKVDEGAQTDEKKGEGEVVAEVTITVPEEEKDKKKEISPAEWVDLLDDQGEQTGLGLRVYTQTQEPARVTGRIRSEDVNWEY